MKKLNVTVVMLIFTIAAFAQPSKKVYTTTESTMVSTSNNDNKYSLTATFSDSNKKTQLIALVTAVLGNANTKADGMPCWKMEDTYSLILSSEKLIVELDKEKASGTLIKNFIQLGKDIQKTLSDSTPEEPVTPN